MNTKQLYQKFLDCNSIIDIDSRSISKGSIFFAIKGENFDGNKFADEALKKGSKIAVIDSDEINSNNNKNIIKVDDSLKTLQDKYDLEIPPITSSFTIFQLLIPIFFSGLIISKV